MDVFAHGLWSAAIYNKKRVVWAVIWGITPDILSFGILFGFSAVFHGSLPFSGGPPPLESLPPFVFTLYNITHSLVVWAVLFGLALSYLKRIPWEFTAWALHIVIDMPTHSTSFFPTPFLWPLPQPFFINGISWGVPWFMALNYGAILLVYFAILRRR